MARGCATHTGDWHTAWSSPHRYHRHCHPFVTILIITKASKFTATTVDERIEAFFVSFFAELESMSDAAFKEFDLLLFG